MKQIEVKNLTWIMRLLDSAQTIASEVGDGFLSRLDPYAQEKESAAQTLKFEQARAKAFAVEILLLELEKELADLGAYTGYPDDQGEEKGADTL